MCVCVCVCLIVHVQLLLLLVLLLRCCCCWCRKRDFYAATLMKTLPDDVAADENAFADTHHDDDDVDLKADVT